MSQTHYLTISSVIGPGTQPQRKPRSFYELPPEIRQLIYIQIFNSVRYPAQAYYHLLHSRQTPLWPSAWPTQPSHANTADLNPMWEHLNNNHGFAYSLHVQRRLLTLNIPLLRTSSLIRAEALPLLRKTLSPPLCIWRDLALESVKQTSNFLSRVDACLQSARVQLSHVTALQLHSDLVLDTAKTFAAWVVRGLPALRTIDLIIDVCGWEAGISGSNLRGLVWHQQHSRLGPFNVNATIQALAPLATVARTVAEVSFTIVVPRFGLCVCSAWHRLTSTEFRHWPDHSDCPHISGESYLKFLWACLQRFVTMMEMMWFAAIKGASRRCSWFHVFAWVAARLEEIRIDPAATFLDEQGTLIEEDWRTSRLNVTWLRGMTGRKPQLIHAEAWKIVMGSETGQKFGWARTSYAVEMRPK